MFWKKKDIEKPIFIPNFEKDFQLLFFLVNLEAENANWEMDMMNTNNMNISEIYISELITKSAKSVINKLSDEYIDIVLKYLDKDGLVMTISELISKDLISKGIKINKSKIGTDVTIDDVEE
jgi:hypothetical protein